MFPKMPGVHVIAFLSCLRHLKISLALRQIGQNSTSQNHPAAATQYREYNSFYYKLEHYPEGTFYFSKWDYANLDFDVVKEGIQYFDTASNAGLVLLKLPNAPIGDKAKNGNKSKAVIVQKCPDGIIIDGTPFSFVRKESFAASTPNDAAAAARPESISSQIDCSPAVRGCGNPFIPLHGKTTSFSHHQTPSYCPQGWNQSGSN